MLTRRAFLIGCSGSAVTVACGPAYRNGLAGSLGDVEADDTGWLQKALDKGGHITLETDRICKVSAQHGARAALFIGSDTFLDLAGATLELAPNQRCAMIAHRPGSRVRNIRIANGTIVGNGARQPADYRRDIGITPTLYLMDCDNLELRDLDMRDTYMYAVYAQGNGGVVEGLSIEDAIGGGMHLDGAQWRIDKVRVRNVTYFERANCQGNPFIVSLRNSEIGSIYCENFGFGVKFQDGCENLTVGSIEAVGGPNNDDFLVKIQGKKERTVERINRNIRIGSIVARNGPKSGLYIIYSDGVEISSYRGENNGRSRPMDAKNGADVLIIDADNVRFGDLYAKGFHRYGLWLHDKTGRVSAEAARLEAAEASNSRPVAVRSGVAVLNGDAYPPGDWSLQ